MPHCMVQPSGEISVMIVPRCRVWEFHPPYWKSFSVIFFFVFVMQFGLWQSSFRIVSDTLVLHLYLHILTKNHPPIFYEIWHTTAPLELDWSLDQMWNLKKTKFKMVDGRHFKIVFGHNSASGCEISLKFCVEKQFFFRISGTGRCPRSTERIFVRRCDQSALITGRRVLRCRFSWQPMRS